jgi:SAM-dependent methyltransferase
LVTESLLSCRLCGAAIAQVFVDLGTSPLSNAYLKKEQLDKMEPFYPLCAYVCERCLLVQLPAVEKRETIFPADYAYFSSFSDSLLKHSEAYANMMMTRFGLGRNSLVVELASNDGYLLQYFKRAGVPVLGVEPSAGVAKAAVEQKGIPTVVRFFGVETAKDLKREGKVADLIAANNVLAHVPDLHDFIGGMKILLGPRGVVTVEFPHLMQLMHENEFDTIYHEHFSYFSFQTARKAFEAHGFKVFDVDEVATHGGSFRVYARHADDDGQPLSEQAEQVERVRAIERREVEAGLHTLATYMAFGEKVNTVKRDLLSFLIKTKEEGKKVVGYGAPAKASTLFNYCGIRRDFIDFTADRSPHKQGMYLPGSHVPIVPPAEIEASKPDYILILPWNLKDEIMTQLEHVRVWGAKFVVAIPRLQIL